MPEWLLAEAMGIGGNRERAHFSASIGDGMLSGLDPLDYRDHDEWFALMVEAHKAGVDRQSWIDWSTSDELYAGDADVIGRRWDSLRIGDWRRRVDARLAELDRGDYGIKHIGGDGRRVCPLPITAITVASVRDRTSAIIDKIRDEPSLFWAACRFREMVEEGRLRPDVAVRLLEGNWRGDKTECRRTIAAAWLTVEDKMTE
jgi:hypothetical protein